MNQISTLHGMEPKLFSHRRAGNTTRIIDNAIQRIFAGETVFCQDHADNGNHRKANIDLFERIIRRLQIEHPGVIGKGSIRIDRERLMIGPDYENKPINGGPLSFGFENIVGV